MLILPYKQRDESEETVRSNIRARSDYVASRIKASTVIALQSLSKQINSDVSGNGPEMGKRFPENVLETAYV